MKILEMPQAGTLLLREVDEPVRSSNTAKIKMEYCGICGSDLTAYTGKNPTVRYPVDGIGHEGIGVITEIGENEQALCVGDRVAISPYIPCLQCHMCAEERFNNCADIRVAGVHTGGVMAEYITFPNHLLHKVPAKLDPLTAALAEPLTIGLHAAARARVTEGDYCVITGAGPIGLLAALGVKSKGATPILVDIVDERLQFAQECGIAHTFNSAAGDVLAYLHDVSGTMPQAMLECTGSPFILAEMHNYVRHGGRIALVGWPKGPVTVNTVRCIQKELDIHPSRNSNKQFPTALALLAQGAIPSDKIITKLVALEDAESVMQDMLQNPGAYMKVVVKLSVDENREES